MRQRAWLVLDLDHQVEAIDNDGNADLDVRITYERRSLPARRRPHPVPRAPLPGLASAPAAPADVRFRTGRLSNDTALLWNANTESDLAGYEIVYRDTVEPRWTHRMKVGNVTSYKRRTTS